MGNTAMWVAVVGFLTTVGGSAASWAAGRRGREAVATKDEADAAESLSTTVVRLGEQVRLLYLQLGQTEERAASAERRAFAAEHRAAAAEHEAALLRGEVGHLRAQLAEVTIVHPPEGSHQP